MTPSSPRPWRIGLLLGEIEHPYSYQGMLLESAREHARTRGFSLRVFMGHGVSTVRWGDYSHTGIYRLAGPELVDGLVITPPVLSLLNPQELQRFLGELPLLPRVFVGRNLPDQSCVTVDNRAGVRDLMDHILGHHGYRRVACIRGPADNQDAIERYDEYCQGLARHGLALDPGLVIEGNFTSADGFQRTRTLVEERQLQFDALVAANDEMALGSMEYFRSIGRDIPRQVAVFGFDDVRASRDCSPPLSTIQQPMAQLVPAAMDLLLDLIGGGQARQVTLPTRLIVRESCGCAQSHAGNGRSALPLLASLQALAGTACPPGSLKDRLQDLVNPANPDPDTLEQLAASLRQHLDTGTAAPEESPAARLRAETTNSIIRILLNLAHNGRFEESATQYTAMTEMNILIRQVTTTRTLPDLRELLDRDLPRLGIACYSLAVCQPDQGKQEFHPGTDDLAFALGRTPCGTDRHDILLSLLPANLQILAARTAPSVAHPTGRVFEPGLPCPPGTGTAPDWLASLDLQDILILPLVTADSWLGVVMFPLTRQNSFYCYGLHSLLANLLDREYRFRELLDQGMKERVSRLAEEGKMKSLNSLVAGVAHEINTPVGIGITSASFVDQLLDSISSKMAAGTLGKQDLTDMLDDSRTSLHLIENSLGRVKNLMERFRSLAMDLSEEHPVQVDLPTFMRTQMEAFRRSCPRKDLDFQLQLAELPHIRTRMGALTLVLSAMLENAAKHAYPDSNGGRITLKVAQAGDQPDQIEFEVRDYGQGMAPEVCRQIFEPFTVMRREGGGMGIGMHIARNLAVFKLKGTLACASTAGQGTSFVLRIPLTGD